MVVVPSGFVVFLIGYHEQDKEGFDTFVTDTLLGGGSVAYGFDDATAEELAKLGIGPVDNIAADVVAIDWMMNAYQWPIDLGIMRVLSKHEYCDGLCFGTWGASGRAGSLAGSNGEDALWMLQWWKDHDARSLSQEAFDNINESYTDWKGGGAGEIGPGIIPETARKVCQIMQQLDDPDLKACDLFSPQGAAYAKAIWLKQIGYSDDLTPDERIAKLYGWNQALWYRELLVREATDVNKKLFDAGFGKLTPYTTDVYSVKGWFRKGLIWVLEMLDIMPDIDTGGGKPPVVINGWADPYPGSKICGNSFQPGGPHFGQDYCIGTYPWQQGPIYAMHDGRVVFARFLSPSEGLAGQWWVSGNTVAIQGTTEDGQKVWTCYGHGSKLEVNVGDQVKAGDLIMQSGNTGYSDGNHLHLCLKIDGTWQNPVPYVNQTRQAK